MAAEAAAEYYRGRMRAVQQQQGEEALEIKASTSLNGSEAQQERLNFELQSIRELNDRLGSLSGGLPYRHSVEAKQLQLRQLQQMHQLEQRHKMELSIMGRQVERLKMQNKVIQKGR